jgi:branched-chain amino acid transport system ATP-binding protein
VSVLTVAGLHAAYATARVLHGVDLEVDAGEVVAVLGRNGMGKTTLLRAISGARPPVCTSGSIRLGSEELLELPVWEVARRGVGAVPQGRRIFGSLTVEENLRIVARPGHGLGWTPARVYELFPRLGERRRQRARTLSGGEQQMLAIGRALVTNPRLLVMDEPSEGLAFSVLATIQERLASLSQENLAVLIAEQNLDLALALAGRVYVLGENGRVTWHGTPEELRGNEQVLRAQLGVGERAAPQEQEHDTRGDSL